MGLESSTKAALRAIGSDVSALLSSVLRRTDQVDFLADYKTGGGLLPAVESLVDWANIKNKPTSFPSIPYYYSSRANTTSIGTMASNATKYTIPWDVADVAGNVPFDTTAKAYTIPVSGLWDIRTQVSFTTPSAAMRVEFALERIRGGVTSMVYSTIVTFGPSGGPSYVSCIAPYLVQCQAGDKFFVTVRANGGTCVLYNVDGFNFFTASLRSVA